jgi:hypothetical protein
MMIARLGKLLLMTTCLPMAMATLMMTMIITKTHSLGLSRRLIMIEWINGAGIKYVSIIILTLTADSNDAEVQVSTGGDELVISEVWCPFLMANVRHI